MQFLFVRPALCSDPASRDGHPCLPLTVPLSGRWRTCSQRDCSPPGESPDPGKDFAANLFATLALEPAECRSSPRRTVAPISFALAATSIMLCTARTLRRRWSTAYVLMWDPSHISNRPLCWLPLTGPTDRRVLISDVRHVVKSYGSFFTQTG